MANDINSTIKYQPNSRKVDRTPVQEGIVDKPVTELTSDSSKLKQDEKPIEIAESKKSD
jgi:hypothetical protein